MMILDIPGDWCLEIPRTDIPQMVELGTWMPGVLNMCPMITNLSLRAGASDMNLMPHGVCSPGHEVS